MDKPTKPVTLTVLQRQVARLLARGLGRQEIRREIFRSTKTVEYHTARIQHAIAAVTGTKLIPGKLVA